MKEKQKLSSLFDLEADGLKPTKVHCICIMDINTGVKQSYDPTQLQAAIMRLEQSDVIIGHHIIGYDIPVLKKLLGFKPKKDVMIVDTLIISQMNKGTRPMGHSLENWGRFLKHPKVEHDEWDEFSPEMMKRCEGDVDLNYKVYRYLLKDNHIPKEASRLEHFTSERVKVMTENGFPFDIKAAQKLIEKLQKRKVELDHILEDMFCPLPKRSYSYVSNPSGDLEKQLRRKPDGTIYANQAQYLQVPPEDILGEFSKVLWTDVNFNSTQFVSRHLMLLGWEPSEFTPTGQPKLGDEQYEELAQSTIPDAKLVGEWSVISRRITQIQSWIESAEERGDGKVHADVMNIGTWTSRMTHRDPNISAVPARGKPYSVECRKMFHSTPGWKQVGCDASGIQLRVLANAMGDPDYAKEVVHGDIHTTHQVAAELETRDQAKTFIYAFLLGAGYRKIGQIAGEPYDKQEKRGKHLKNTFLKRIPALADLIQRKKAEVARNDYIIALDGRRIYVPDPHYALTAVLQGDEAIIMKRSHWFWHQDTVTLQTPYRLLQWSHDEWQTETPPKYSDQLGKLMVDSFRKTQVYYNCTVELTGEYKVGDNWYGTH